MFVVVNLDEQQVVLEVRHAAQLPRLPVLGQVEVVVTDLAVVQVNPEAPGFPGLGLRSGLRVDVGDRCAKRGDQQQQEGQPSHGSGTHVFRLR